MGGGQQILVCEGEPQKSAYVCLFKIQSLNSFKIPDAGFHLIHTSNQNNVRDWCVGVVWHG